MRRDWVVWLGCFLLFGCGAVWAQVPLKTSFFVIDSVHDLFEVLGALATVVAVCVAAANINTWKHQVNASADLELARKVVTALYRYKDKIMTTWGWAEFSVEQLHGDEKPTPELSDAVNETIQASIDESDNAALVLKDLLLECQSAWRLNFDIESTFVYMFSDRCSLVAKSYILWSRTYHLDSQVAARSEKSIRTHWSWFEKNKCENYSDAITHLERLLSKLERRIEEKLLLS
ncbi:hypothetical protein HNR03_000152 [Pseudomonas sp. JAI111]|uniref:hypothetical protein n=1 Tax=Pseudomonas sp. JAI111 TaxID=2735913 RepID=UPI002168D913|nr:hypothetical protein [Pseudomonas sp. JAI111]MCS3835572.1 hypothetical protein [Pseudomonas sp. JAI111]